MRSFVLAHWLPISIALALVLSAAFVAVRIATEDPLANLVTTTTEVGNVEFIVSVSGVTESSDTADLTFPTSGIVSGVYVKEGDVVEAGTLLATLATAREEATVSAARAAVTEARATLIELTTGERPEAKAVTAARVNDAKAEVERVTAAGALAIENARRTLYSNDLTARSTKGGEDATPPVITGTYRCTEPGTYTLRVYSSGTASGYSMTVSGIEIGTFEVGTTQPIAFGNCGLFAQFSENDRYQNSVWTITIPNTDSATYLTAKNALENAEQTAKDTIARAENDLAIAQSEQNLENAPARSEAVLRAEAAVQAAEAELATALANIADRSIVAPFPGTIATVDITAGETAPTTPAISLLNQNSFTIKARIPEIDITKVAVGQSARVEFDADQGVTHGATITTIAPLPINIDGVSYFEVTLTLVNQPTWLRGGLNADIDIITGQVTDVVRVPIRYVTETNGITTVQTLRDTTLATTTVTVTFRGNDGYVAVPDIAPGTTIVAP